MLYLEDSEEKTIKVVAGKYRVPLNLIRDGQKVICRFNFNRALIDEIKSMKGARWVPERKFWTIEHDARNYFQLSFLAGESVFAPWDQDYPILESERPLREHQRLLKSHFVFRPGSIGAFEMGLGKTLSWIEAMEYLDYTAEYEIWYIGPRSGLKSVQLELIKWKARIKPRMLTYEALVKVLTNWPGGDAPRAVCFDEASKLKNPLAQRSKAALYLANKVREEWEDEARIIEMTGTPSPKNPGDWWHLAEVACPGFFREGTRQKFESKLCIIEQRENPITGGVYPHVVSWLDNNKKCSKCGELGNHANHQVINMNEKFYHSFSESKNEVERLAKRLKGLALIRFKRECLDMPEKQYQIIHVKPSVEILRAAKLIRSTGRRAITVLTLLRELCDGFQYIEKEAGTKVCELCRGTGKMEAPVPKTEVDITAPLNVDEESFVNELVTCGMCGGEGVVPKMIQSTMELASPKDDIFIDELDECEEIGRYVVWGGFTGTIDRLVHLAHKKGWSTLRVDGRGFVASDPLGATRDADEFLAAMDRSHHRFKEFLTKYPKICFVGHPQAGGMGLTLTASPVALKYSQCFNAEAEIQSEDRIHRLGMDETRGATIKTIIMLPTCQLVYDNIQAKKQLQATTMGDLESAFKKFEDEQNVDRRS